MAIAIVFAHRAVECGADESDPVGCDKTAPELLTSHDPSTSGAREPSQAPLCSQSIRKKSVVVFMTVLAGLMSIWDV